MCDRTLKICKQIKIPKPTTTKITRAGWWWELSMEESSFKETITLIRVMIHTNLRLLLPPVHISLLLKTGKKN
uniref:Uncharacterized protein n=1 Tax=Plectus sambesii TaxID=2011161 RepID=A0A914WK51_9BILA